jgi:hypothetical protein
LLHRAQNAEVKTPTPKIPASAKKTSRASKSSGPAKINPDPDEA